MNTKHNFFHSLSTWLYHGREVLYASRAAAAPDCFDVRHTGGQLNASGNRFRVYRGMNRSEKRGDLNCSLPHSWTTHQSSRPM